jgi:hypothetical protein
LRRKPSEADVAGLCVIDVPGQFLVTIVHRGNLPGQIRVLTLSVPEGRSIENSDAALKRLFNQQYRES